MLLIPNFCEKLKIAPPIGKQPPPQTFEFPNSAEKSVSISAKTFLFFWRPPDFERKKALNFGFRPKNQTQFRRRPFFFFLDHLILGGKKLWISDFGRKIRLNFGEDLSFFFFETTWFWEEKSFEFPSFPRNFVSIFGQTVWFWFNNNENSGQGRLHFSHSFKIAPPFSKSWLRACLPRQL